MFGGQSVEHEVSIRSAKNVLAALDKDKYQISLINISKNGGWQLLNSNQVKYLTKVNSTKSNTKNKLRLNLDDRQKWY